MIRCLPALLFAATLLAGCDATDATQPLPTVESDGSLSIPAGYRPDPEIDTSRVDCEQYFALNPAEVRDEAGRLCATSSDPAERERNPYCQIEAITAACTSRRAPGGS